MKTTMVSLFAGGTILYMILLVSAIIGTVVSAILIIKERANATPIEAIDR